MEEDSNLPLDKSAMGQSQQEPLGRVDKRLQPEACSGEVEEAFERQGGFVIAGGDAALLFELAEHALDAIAILVAPIVGMDRVPCGSTAAGMIGRMPRMSRFSRNPSPS